jgi:hypothetical protein
MEKLGGRLRVSNRSSSSSAEKSSESSDKHGAVDGAVAVIWASRSRANCPHRAGASAIQIGMCFTSKEAGGLPSITRRRSRGLREAKGER